MAIDGADAGADDGERGDEEAFVELAEYVRVGVLLVNEELKPVAGTGAPNAPAGHGSGGSVRGSGGGEDGAPPDGIVPAARRLH